MARALALAAVLALVGAQQYTPPPPSGWRPDPNEGAAARGPGAVGGTEPPAREDASSRHRERTLRTRRHLLGHQSNNAGLGLTTDTYPYLHAGTDGDNLYYEDGKYPADHPSLVGFGDNTILGGDWDQRYVEPLEAKRLAGGTRPAIMEQYMSQRGYNGVGMMELLLMDLNELYCDAFLGRLPKCPDYEVQRKDTWKRLYELVCGWDDSDWGVGGVSELPVTEQFEFMFGKCKAPWTGDLMTTMSALFATINREAGDAREIIDTVLVANNRGRGPWDYLPSGGEPENFLEKPVGEGQGWRSGGWGQGRYVGEMTPSTEKAWEWQRKRTSTVFAGEFAKKMEQQPEGVSAYQEQYVNHRSPFAQWQEVEGGAVLSWAYPHPDRPASLCTPCGQEEGRWCVTDHRGLCVGTTGGFLSTGQVEEVPAGVDETGLPAGGEQYVRYSQSRRGGVGPLPPGFSEAAYEVAFPTDDEES